MLSNMVNEHLKKVSIQIDESTGGGRVTSQAHDINNNNGTFERVAALMKSSQTNNKPVIHNELVSQLEASLAKDSLRVNQLNRIVENAIHWSLVNGFVLVPKDRKETDLMVVSYIPFTLFPSPIRRVLYDKVCNLQPKINRLMNKLANSEAIMRRALDDVLSVDPFISSLWRLYQHALVNGYNQPIQLSVLRVDYMLHHQNSIKQVEINTISAGFGYVSTRMSQLHRQILNWSNAALFPTSMFAERMPEQNVPVEKIANGFVQAWRAYDRPRAIILFVVLEIEINIADQRHLEYEIVNQESRIEIVRCTLEQIENRGQIVCDEEKRLYYDDKEVAVVYYRAGYDPEHYKTQKEWDALLKVEMSRAIKCPNLGMFLAGMKKFQEYMSVESNLNELCDMDTSLTKSLQEVFAKFLKLDDENNLSQIISNVDDYVLKPQREGGGHNFYHSDIKNILSKIQEDEALNGHEDHHNNGTIYDKSLYIAMELLKAPLTENFIVSARSQQQHILNSGQPFVPAITNDKLSLKKIQTTYELGIYGVLLQNGDKELLNETCGYCLRTKPSSENEAGVMHGSGALDSIYFTD